MYVIPHQMTDIDARLRNWGRVVRDHRPGPRQTGSFEGRYRSGQCWEEVPIPISLPLTGRDIKDGWEVEAAWVSLSRQHRQALRARYCWRTAVREGPLLLAKAAILTALERTEDQNRNIVCRLIKITLALVPGKVYNDATT